MKTGIHPEYVETTVTCTCGNTFTTRSTAKNGVIHADICSSCHPFYTGKQKILDTGGRVARFERRFGKQQAAAKQAADAKAEAKADSKADAKADSK
jgi:large subunit ribosomal protein L31